VEKDIAEKSQINLFPDFHALHEIIWKKYGRLRQAINDNAIRHMHFALWTTKATDTH